MLLKIKFGNIIFKIISIFLPVKKRVFFISSLKNKLWDSSQVIYDNLDCEKKVYYWNVPHSIKDLIKLSFYIMTSKVIIIDNTNIYFAFIKLKKQQKLIHVGHGCCGPVKKLAMDRKNYNPYEKFCNNQYDDFLVASDSASEYYASAYGIKKESFTKIGHPCTDLLIHNKNEYKNEFYEEYPDLINKKIIVYMPTFRLDDDNDDYLRDYNFGVDWDKLDKCLDGTNYMFIIKRHPVMIQNNIKIITKEYNNIVDVVNISSYSLMVVSDLLITDYSSIFQEYLLLDKPIIFYCPDLEEYSKSTGFYLKIPDDLPGIFCQNHEELINALSNSKEAIDYSVYKEKFVKYCDGNSTKNVLKIIEEYLNK